jgi:hypothetical protein
MFHFKYYAATHQKLLRGHRACYQATKYSTLLHFRVLLHFFYGTPREDERGHGSRLVFEACRELGLRKLDGDDTIQPRVPRFVDFTHAAGTDQRVDFVARVCRRRMTRTRKVSTWTYNATIAKVPLSASIESYLLRSARRA